MPVVQVLDVTVIDVQVVVTQVVLLDIVCCWLALSQSSFKSIDIGLSYKLNVNDANFT